MSTVGIVFLTVALTFVGLFFLVKFGIRFWISRLIKSAQTMAPAYRGVVARITMTLEKLTFKDSRVYGAMRELKALGYQSAGRYTIDEMPGLQLWAGTHPENGSLALVFEVTDRLFCVDLIRFYSNGAVLGAGTNPAYDPEHYPSHMQYHVFPADAPIKDIAQWLAARPQQDKVVLATPRNLRYLNANMYAMTMDHQLSMPVSPFDIWKTKTTKEILAQGHSVSQFTERQWLESYEAWRASFEAATQEAMKDHLLRGNSVTALEWNEIQHHLVFVYERLSAEEVAELALTNSQWTTDESHIESLLRKNLSHEALFDAIQELLPLTQRFHYLADVQQPLPARVYRPVAQD